MRITRNTPEQLILSSQPWLVAVMLVAWTVAFAGAGIFMIADGVTAPGLLFILGGLGMGGLFLYVFARRTQVIFDAHARTVTIRRKTMRAYSEVIHGLDEIGEAYVDERRGKNGKVRRPVLRIARGMSQGDVPLVEHYSNFGRTAQAVAAINDWLGRA